jgi:hypothetical protein
MGVAVSIDPSDSYDGAPFRIPLELLRLKPPVTAGLDPFTLLGCVPLLRKTSGDHDPILVDAQCPTCRSFRIQDGRHRYVASVMAGRHDIVALRDPGGEHG